MILYLIGDIREGDIREDAYSYGYNIKNWSVLRFLITTDVISLYVPSLHSL